MGVWLATPAREFSLMKKLKVVAPSRVLRAAVCLCLLGQVAASAVAAVPAALQAEGAPALLLSWQAKGVQIYECAAAASGRHEWQFKAPEADLSDAQGKPVGRHYAGPSWEALDGSKLVGEVKARDPGPDASAIPWLLLNARSVGGAGVLAAVSHIQRVDTVGGRAPAEPCGAERAGQQLRVPYTAVYHFLGAAR